VTPSQNQRVGNSRTTARPVPTLRAVKSIIVRRWARVSAPNPLLACLRVPTYEYKCPKGHVFEVFKRIADPSPAACEVCGASPVETVLYPVPVHFRGSGFYTTDYGRGKGAKKDAGETSSSDSSSGSGDAKDKSADKPEKKAAEA
jgi:putative FmdB family regulatory protein